MWKLSHDWKGRLEEKQRKEKSALDVKFAGMTGGSGCGRSRGTIARESFKQGLVAGHDRPSQQIWHIGRETERLFQQKYPKRNLIDHVVQNLIFFLVTHCIPNM